MQSWANNAFALLLLATPALATPPQVVSITETLFARTDYTIILLREMTDNHGLHSVLQTDTMVVTKSLERGDDRGFRMVARVLDMGQDAGENRVIFRGPTNPFHPYSLFSDGAWPLRESHQSWISNDAVTVTLDDENLTIARENFGPPDAYTLSTARVSEQVSSALTATRFFAPLERIGGGTTGPDQFNPMLFNITRDCTITALQFLYDAPADPALAQIQCDDIENGTQSATLWLIVPVAPP